MIPLKLGRRLSALFCAVALMAALVAFPLRARAAAALPAIGYAVTISAFLAACGIYPFQNETGESFGEWGARRLTELWNTYITEVYPQSEGAQLISDVKSFYANGGYMVMAADTWSRLREFASWIVDKFSLADSQNSVHVGTLENGLAAIPAFSSPPSEAQLMAYGLTVLSPTPTQDYGYYGVNASDVYGAIVGGLNRNGDYEYYVCMVSEQPFTMYRYVYAFQASLCQLGVSGQVFDYYLIFENFGRSNQMYFPDGVTYSLSSAWPYYSYITAEQERVIRSEIVQRLYGVWGGLTYSGIMADTSVVQLLDELPEGAQMGGLAVAGAGAGADALEDVIASGVMERQKPTVRSVEVQIGEGTEVDAGTGAVAQAQSDTLVITPELAETLPVASDFAAPQALVDSLVSALRTKFPFCLPFDALRIASAFLKEPLAPVISMTFHDPFSNSDYTISVDLAPWDDVAAVLRQLQSLLLLVGFMLNAPKVLLFKEMLS